MDNEEYHWHLKNCSFVIINKPNNLRNSYNFATKLGEYMSYGSPIITTTVGESKQYLIDGENAYCLKDDSVECIIEKINELLGNQSRAIEIGIKSYETAISNFHYQKYALKLSNFLENL
jgi:glycosyltransferase involved in cell wall biosynthesis